MLNNEVGFTLECRPGPGVRIFEVCLLLRGLREASISDSVTSDPVLSFTVTFPIGAGHLLPWSWPTQVHLFRHEVILFFSSWLLPRCSVLLKAPPNFPWCYTHQIPGPADPSCFTSWLSCFQAHFSCLSFGTGLLFPYRTALASHYFPTSTSCLQPCSFSSPLQAKVENWWQVGFSFAWKPSRLIFLIGKYQIP